MSMTPNLEHDIRQFLRDHGVGEPDEDSVADLAELVARHVVGLRLERDRLRAAAFSAADWLETRANHCRENDLKGLAEELQTDADHLRAALRNSEREER